VNSRLISTYTSIRVCGSHALNTYISFLEYLLTEATIFLLILSFYNYIIDCLYDIALVNFNLNNNLKRGYTLYMMLLHPRIPEPLCCLSFNHLCNIKSEKNRYLDDLDADHI